MTAAANKKGIGMQAIKTGLLLFWGTFFLLTFLTNLFDLFGTEQYLQSGWHFRSGNYALVLSTINIYRLPFAVGMFLFVCDIILQGWLCVLFFVTAYKFWSNKKPWFWVNFSFGIATLLWGLFIIMDELFIAYNLEGTHMTFITFTLIAFMAMHNLPDKRSSN